MRVTVKARMLAYELPALNVMCTNLLKTERMKVENEEQDQIGDSVNKYNITLSSDGWDDV